MKRDTEKKPELMQGDPMEAVYARQEAAKAKVAPATETPTTPTNEVAPVSPSVPDVAPRLVPVSVERTRVLSDGLVVGEIFVGVVVVFRISADESPEQILRPFLINTVIDPDQVAGDLFLNPVTDWAYEWVRQNIFVQLNHSNRIVPVKLAWRGLQMGQWRP